MVIVANINERTNQNLIYQTKYFRFRSFLMDFDFIKTQVPLPLTPLFIFTKLFQSFWVQSAQIKSGYICSRGQRSLQTNVAARLEAVEFWFKDRTGSWIPGLNYPKFAVPGSYNQGWFRIRHCWVRNLLPCSSWLAINSKRKWIFYLNIKGELKKHIFSNQVEA